MSPLRGGGTYWRRALHITTYSHFYDPTITFTGVIPENVMSKCTQMSILRIKFIFLSKQYGFSTASFKIRILNG